MRKPEELMASAMENMLVADMFERKALDMIYHAMFSGEKLDRKEIEHLLGCAGAHRNSVMEILEGDFGPLK
jgi:hypothetical protein